MSGTNTCYKLVEPFTVVINFKKKTLVALVNLITQILARRSHCQNHHNIEQFTVVISFKRKLSLHQLTSHTPIPDRRSTLRKSS